MIIGTVKEIKTHEYRVALSPASVHALVHQGHSVWIETQAGLGSGFQDADYLAAGGRIAPDAASVWAQADLLVKVKEPLPAEYPWLRPGQLLFTYLHCAASQELTLALQKSGCIAIAYETVEDAHGRLPLLAPMSEIAGRMAVQQVCRFLEKPQGGKGLLATGMCGVQGATFVILGAGVVGSHAARVAAGLGATVYVLDTHIERLRHLQDTLPANVTTLFSTPLSILKLASQADGLISSVLIKGAKAPCLITRDTLRHMAPGSVLVDVAIDQGGSCETSRPTTHQDPVYVEEGILHYCVANMPGAVPQTASQALSNATLPYILELANKGYADALLHNAGLALGVNVARGHITYPAVATAFGLQGCSWQEALSLSRS
jgi:alanine dehydrogenase